MPTKWQLKHYNAIKRVERRFDFALQALEEENYICGFYKTEQNGELDRLGIDYFLYLQGGLLYPVQLKFKSSLEHFNKAIERHYQKHPFIKDIFGITLEDSTYKIINLVKEGINSAIGKTKKLI